jgi:cytidylate kinase-like protein
MSLKLDRFISSQIKYWEQQKSSINLEAANSKPPPFITISREYGAGGYEIGLKIAELLSKEKNGEKNWAAYDKNILENISNDLGLSKKLAETLTNDSRSSLTSLMQATFKDFPPQITVFKKLVEIERMLASNGHVILIGRAGNLITKNLKGGFHIRIVSDMKTKSEKISKTFEISKHDAEKMIIEKSDLRESFIKKFVKFDTTNPHNYHLFVNSSKYSTEQTAQIIIEGMKILNLI